MANEARNQEIEVSGTTYGPAAIAALERSLAAVDALDKLFQRVAEVAIKATHPSQWTDLGGKPWPTGPAAETIALRFGIRMTNVRREVFRMEDEHGKYNLWVYTAQFALPGDAHILEAEGTCSSRDGFIGLEVQGDGYDEGNIMKAALTNCRINGIMQILGLRGMPWERLELLGIKRGDVPKVEYQKGGRGGGSKSSTPVAEREIPFGRAKGKKLQEADEGDLKWLREKMAASINDPEKSKFKAENEAWVAAIDGEFARRANAKSGVGQSNGSAAPSIYQRIKALPEAKDVEEKDLPGEIKTATGKEHSKDLVEADIPKVQEALKKRAADEKGIGF